MNTSTYSTCHADLENSGWDKQPQTGKAQVNATHSFSMAYLGQELCSHGNSLGYKADILTLNVSTTGSEDWHTLNKVISE